MAGVSFGYGLRGSGEDKSSAGLSGSTGSSFASKSWIPEQSGLIPRGDVDVTVRAIPNSMPG